jgi:predicted AAA+ superfamily ATPase
LKELHFQDDCLGKQWNLFYLRNKDGKEIDFLVTHNERPALMIEVKWSDSNRSPNFSLFEKYVNRVRKVQVVKELTREKTYPDGTEIRRAGSWLSEISLV